MRVAGIVVAAGTGERLGSDVPKAFVALGGATLLAHAVGVLRGCGLDQLVAVVPPGWEDRAVADVGADATVVAGGDTRTASVAAGMAALDDDVEVVAVHDAARPLVPVEVVADAVAAVVDGALAAAPGLAVADTLKQVDGDGVVAGTVDRSDLVAIQTPQVFRRAALARGHAAAGDGATDDLALVEDLVARGELSGRVVVTRGSTLAMKVTRPADLLVATALVTATRALDAGTAP